MFLAVVLTMGIAIRGGLQTKPLNLAHAYKNSNPRYGQLTLNAPITLIKTKNSEKLAKLTFFPNWQSLKAEISQPKSYNTKNNITKPNFVIIILESMSKEYMGNSLRPEGYAPFLKQLAKKSLDYEFSFANGQRSIETMMTIFGGLPNLMRKPLITSVYNDTKLRGLPKILADFGYDNCFFHGGREGTMFFDSQAKMLGFQCSKWSHNFPKARNNDGTWGIFDGPFLQYFAKETSKLKEPFISGVFTLSSHSPYEIPKNISKKFPKGTLPIHEAIGYTDHALQNFFKTAKQTSWFENTIFVITGDHTSLSNAPEYQNPIGRFRVPIIWYSPKYPLNFASTKYRVTQHIDITPTILSLLGKNHIPHARFGRSLTAGDHGRALLREGNSYYFVGRESLILAQLPNTFLKIKWPIDPNFQLPEPAPNIPDTRQFKAQIQYYNNGIIENRLNF